MFKLIFSFVLLSLLIFLPIKCFSQQNVAADFDIADLGRPNLKIFSNKDGLPQNDILAIAFDQKGYLWVGTDNGAAYYNGYKWTTVAFPEKASKRVNDILATPDGSIWFGINNAILRLKLGEWQVFRSESIFGNIDTGVKIASFTKNNKLEVLFGTAKGVFKFQDEKLIPFYPELLSYPIEKLFVSNSPSNEPVIWVSTVNKGLIRFESEKATIYNNSNGLPSDKTGPILETIDKQGNKKIWVGTNKGLACLTNDTWTTYNSTNGLPGDFITSLCQTRNSDDSNTLWVGTNKGLASWDNHKWVTYDVNKGLPDNRIVSLRAINAPKGDRELWIGTLFGGLARMSLTDWLTFDIKAGLPANPIFAFLETKTPDEKPTFWFGTDNGIAYLADNKLKTYNQKDGLVENWVFGLANASLESDKKIIAGLERTGLSVLEGNTWKTIALKNGIGIHNLLETTVLNNEALLLGVAGGNGKVFRLIKEEFVDYTEMLGLTDKSVFFLAETKDSKGNKTLWAGTNKGIARFRDGKREFFDNSSGLPNDSILSVLETTDHKGKEVIWVGTTDGAAKCYLADLEAGKPNWQIFSTKSSPALPNDYIYQILVDNKKRIYLSTNYGVARLTPLEPTATDTAEYSIYSFTIADGLPSNECNRRSSMVDSQGRIWIGTIGGAAMFDPAKEIVEDSQKPLIIEKSFLTNSSTNLTNKISLPYDKNNITFEFALLSFFQESNTLYQTQLKGLDEKPSQWTTDHKKEYTTLPAGDYVFQVWGKDNYGNVTGPVEFYFTINFAPWHTWPAYLLYLLTLSGLIFGIVKIQLQRLEKQNQLLETKVAQRTIELDKKNEELSKLVEEIKQAKSVTEEKVEELAKKNAELEESYKRADRIFSVLANALPGTILDGKYQLEDKIGSGGFGAVYRAMHLGLNRHVAVKVFRPSEKNASAEALERFRLEGVSACRVNHPNAITILDSGISSEGIAYLVMELLQGQTLATEIKTNKTLSLGRIAQIIIPVCDVLEKAHSAGIIHRDIKPDNIFLHQSKDGEIVKVVDFGIAKLVSEHSTEDNLTGTGNFVGTPAYMAPERLGNNNYDGRSDVYSLGVILYQMLAGRLPFRDEEKDGPLAVILAHLTKEPPRVKELNPDLPIELEKIVMQAMEKDPKFRPTAKHLAEGLAEALGIELEISNSGVYKFSISDLSEIELVIPSYAQSTDSNSLQSTEVQQAYTETFLEENPVKNKVRIKHNKDKN